LVIIIEFAAKKILSWFEIQSLLQTSQVSKKKKSKVEKVLGEGAYINH